jgi:hypothetical protein
VRTRRIAMTNRTATTGRTTDPTGEVSA